MAIYHLSAQVIGRSAGRSCVAAAAYRATERLVDHRTGLTHDFSRRREEAETFIAAPEGAPDWVHDRNHLWNEVESVEKRKDAQLAREINVALPKELSPEHQRELVRAYVQDQFVSQGMVADVAIHRANPENPHAHIMLSMRGVGPDGFGAKIREWNRPEMLEKWREQWADHTNRILERERILQRIDHRSLEAQGIHDREPQVHEGPHVRALESRGVETERGAHNREIQARNAIVIDLEEAREKRKALLTEKSVLGRLEDRTAHGWTTDEARSLADLERSHGGRELTEKDLTEERDRANVQLRQVQEEIKAIDQQRRDIELSRDRIQAVKQAELEVRKHLTPWGTMRRWFDQSARRDLHLAQNRLDWAKESLTRSPIKTESALKHRVSEYRVEEARLPGLNSRVETLSRGVGFLNKLIQAFQKDIRQQKERDRVRERVERMEREARERSRGGYDRGR